MQQKIEVCRIAIDARAKLAALYNAAEIELYPYQLIERNEAIYLRAVNPAKARREDEGPALGLFHLAGLGELRLTGDAFEPLADADLSVPREGDKVIASV